MKNMKILLIGLFSLNFAMISAMDRISIINDTDQSNLTDPNPPVVTLRMWIDSNTPECGSAEIVSHDSENSRGFDAHSQIIKSVELKKAQARYETFKQKKLLKLNDTEYSALILESRIVPGTYKTATTGYWHVIANPGADTDLIGKKMKESTCKIGFPLSFYLVSNDN